jgi:hypothetical protein
MLGDRVWSIQARQIHKLPRSQIIHHNFAIAIPVRNKCQKSTITAQCRLLIRVAAIEGSSSLDWISWATGYY